MQIPMATICMKCQILFPGKNQKNISKCCLLKILPTVLNIKGPVTTRADASLKYFLTENKT